MISAPILVDVTEHGRVRPWAERKRQSLAVAAAFRSLGQDKRGERITHCGAYLEFESWLRPATGERQKRRTKSSFCKQRLCPNCQWRRSLLLYGQVCEAVEGHLEDAPNDRLIMLTLTMRNCSAADLSACLSRLTTAFRRLSDMACFKRAVKGWFRSLEVTRPAGRGDYHPHLHVLLVVPAAYFDQAFRLYLTQPEWKRLWKSALRVPYEPVCDVRVVGDQGVRKGLAEVTKYCTKPADWLTFEGGPAARWRADPEIVRELAAGLRSKRLVGWGGVLKAIHKARGFVDVEDDDPAVLGWLDLPPGWVSEGREAYNFRGRRDDVPGEFFLMRSEQGTNVS